MSFRSEIGSGQGNLADETLTHLFCFSSAGSFPSIMAHGKSDQNRLATFRLVAIQTPTDLIGGPINGFTYSRFHRLGLLVDNHIGQTIHRDLDDTPNVISTARSVFVSNGHLDIANGRVESIKSRFASVKDELFGIP